MTQTLLTLDGVAFSLADGRPLFAGLSETFDRRRTGLVGRNGIGKTVLGRLLAGELAPSAGRVLRQGRVYRLAQQLAPEGTTLAQLAGVHEALQALDRIEAGAGGEHDFEILAERWDLRARLQAELQRAGLPPLAPETPAARLSGGQAMRVALAGAWLADADFLILDEPSNHLDRAGRQALLAQLARWQGGLLVISHDRELLETMQAIVELSPLGLRRYGGGWSFHAEQQAQQRCDAADELARRQLERRRETAALQREHERQQQRQARGRRERADGSQPKLVLDARQERSEATTGRLQRRHDTRRAELEAQVRAAAARVVEDTAIVVPPLPPAVLPNEVLVFDGELPFVAPPLARLSLVLQGATRLAVTGPNGCGKSTLLRVLAGRLAPAAGRCERRVACAWLDQRLADLEPSQPAIEWLRAACRQRPEAELHTRLAQLGLAAATLGSVCGALSGGERLKLALARALLADEPARLLLLDEPGNHLDLATLQALEAMLRGWRGALVVVSHDEAFLAALALHERLEATPQGWCRS
ncbi:ATP-binding cassette domain-containing protein [Rubrivivax gelatinosus]|uniref:ABC transporter ATP-binding protein n=1 Tax=Rubrivivax gelatinosus TaxID=28068 RepID=A0ABS1DRT5_RUBGE|nr:ATP-binding cassette domain-containing protein [Rubrivivax gelatinosus]MBK1712406.1 ABC transporter ATP-binding protein [Rubrivivax gelatinosus]